MSEAVAHVDDHPHPNYMAVFYTLFAVTVAEVAIVYVPMAQWMLIIVLMIMALFKAGLVGMYFMHLKYDNKVLTLIATTPLILVAIALAVVGYEYANYEPTAVSNTSNAVQLQLHE